MDEVDEELAAVQAVLDEHAPSISEGPFFGRDGSRITWAQFAHRKMRPETRDDVVAREQVGDFEVSTVWLGWSEGTDLSGRPLIFETAIFANERDFPVIVGKYTTEEEALDGHQRTVGMLQDGHL